MITKDLKHVKAEGDSHARPGYRTKAALNRKLKTIINQFWAQADMLPTDVGEKYEGHAITRVASTDQFVVANELCKTR